MEEAFKELYEVNVQRRDLGVAVGRYPEDKYDGTGTSEGNPWVLATLGLAEFYYRLAEEKSKAGGSDGEEVKGWVEKAEGFMKRVMTHTGSDYNLHEQFNRNTGFMQGATELTWSHAAFITAVQARHHVMKVLEDTRKGITQKATRAA